MTERVCALLLIWIHVYVCLRVMLIWMVVVYAVIVCATIIQNIGRTQWQRRRLIKIELYKSIGPLGLILCFVYRKMVSGLRAKCIAFIYVFFFYCFCVIYCVVGRKPVLFSISF